ncbi:MAG: molybdate ABC transporter permease subunit [Deltaproteobacteria bacterium]|jgi:molybdate transport system permease protein|nr:molybdate ABC transporter permease subunit [Deltaproteobacteria bacterium]
MLLSPADVITIKLSIKLGIYTTVISLLFGGPLAWWLSRRDTFFRRIVASITTMPLVLPPTVLGFYLLVFMGPFGPIGKLFKYFDIKPLPFTFAGLVVASVICSMPFVVQPLRNAFEALGERPLEAAATLGASPLDAFLTVILPQAKPAFLTAGIMSFAHAIGEFGVVLMIGGNIPSVTRVLSMQIYVYVENMEYSRAHVLAGGLVAVAILTMLSIQLLNPKRSTTLIQKSSS